MNAISIGARDQITVGDRTFDVFRLDRVDDSARLPYSLKLLLENLLRNEDGRPVPAEQIHALAAWDPTVETSTEIQFTPARVLLHWGARCGRPGCHARIRGTARVGF
jgi:aconitate hydratase